MLAIRRATQADAPAVSALLIATWHDTYDAMLGPERVAEITARWHAPDVLARQAGAAGPAFLVAQTREGIVGHAFAHPDRGDPGLVLLQRLYVRPEAQRRGVGEALLAAVLDAFASARAVRLEAQAENAKALRFYGKHGFVAVARKHACGSESGVATVVMERRLPASPHT